MLLKKMSKNEKIIKRKIYSLLLESNKFSFLSVQYAFTLEEAIFLAKVEFEKDNPHKSLLIKSEAIRLSLYSSKTIEDLNSTVSDENIEHNSSPLIKKETKLIPQELQEMFDSLEVEELDKELDKIRKVKEIPEDKLPTEECPTPLDPKSEKNVLIKRIIDEKNEDLFKRHKASLSANERKYIIKRLK